MAKENPDALLQAEFSFDVRFMRRGKHSVALALPEAYHAPIGLIIAHWGDFERTFDACLSGIIKGEAADGRVRKTDGWERRTFKHRRSLFKDICSEWLHTWKPDESKKLVDIADRAGDLSWRRNMIAHGTYDYTIAARSSSVKNCRAVNFETGEDMPFDEKILKKLYHDISHLNADLLLAFKSFGKVNKSFFPMIVSDEEILRVYRETNHPWHPNPKKRTPNA